MRPLFAILCASLLAACQVAPGTGRESFNIISSDKERAMGAEAHPDILRQFGGAYDDPLVQAYVAGIGQRLVRASETPDAEFRFTVLNSDIVNAMALPGGYVYVTRGLLALADDEAELAGVIGHEIGHVTGRHTAQRYSRSMATNVLVGVLGIVIGQPGLSDVAQLGAAAYLQGFSRDQEDEADSLGARYLSRAGYDARAMVSFLDRLRDHARLEALLAGRNPDSVDEYNFMASHPRTADRVQQVANQVLGSQNPGGATSREQFLSRIDGLVHGDDPQEGVVRNRAFLHSGLGIRFEVPQGFRLVNGEKAVTASHPDGSLVRYDMSRNGQAGPAAHIRSQWGRNLALGEIESLTINGLPAATATARAQTNKGVMDVRLVAVATGSTIHRLMFITPPRSTAAHQEELKRLTYSFRQLSAEERAGIRAHRVRIVTVAPGDTVESLSARQPFDSYRVERFRVMNGLEPGQPLQAGHKLKLVVE